MMHTPYAGACGYKQVRGGHELDIVHIVQRLDERVREGFLRRSSRGIVGLPGAQGSKLSRAREKGPRGEIGQCAAWARA